jgi:cobalt/nickel transport system permease protein
VGSQTAIEVKVDVHEHGHKLGDHLYIHRHSFIHDLHAASKLIAVLLFIIVVVLTPNTEYWTFGLYLLLIFGVLSISKLPPLRLMKRMVVEVPFVIFALMLPIFGRGPDVEVLGLSLSEAGLIAGFGLLAKATLGVMSSMILAATTPAREILNALAFIKLPNTLVQIASFMVRYSAVVLDELQRMKIARESRGFTARGVKHWRVLAQSAGALFIRSYERGERVHLAMLSRGYKGTMDFGKERFSRSDYVAFLLPAVAIIFLIGSLV